ncbi:MAG: protein translocase subunit SecF [Bacteroidetes bacterium]|nr:protein translocase subunit SecF [Bacteroidota bacterium]
MRILENTNFRFTDLRTRGYITSGILLLVSVISLFVHGLEVGIDFRGGREFVVDSTERIDVGEARSVLADALGAEPEVKVYDGDKLLVRAAGAEDVTAVSNTIVDALAASFEGSEPRVVGTYAVSARFADDLKRGAIYSVLGSLLVIFIYILLRFEWRFGVGAVAALFHDVTITLGIFSIFHGFVPFSLQIDQTIIAAFLTIVGYSLNDTVVVFDRIREYTGIFKSESYETVINKSINNTLSRTIITSGTTLFVVVVLFIFGGEVLRGFAFALMIGIGIGTYSSIFVASPLVLELRKRAVATR